MNFGFFLLSFFLRTKICICTFVRRLIDFTLMEKKKFSIKIHFLDCRDILYVTLVKPLQNRANLESSVIWDKKFPKLQEMFLVKQNINICIICICNFTKVNTVLQLSAAVFSRCLGLSGFVHCIFTPDSCSWGGWSRCFVHFSGFEMPVFAVNKRQHVIKAKSSKWKQRTPYPRGSMSVLPASLSPCEKNLTITSSQSCLVSWKWGKKKTRYH